MWTPVGRERSGRDGQGTRLTVAPLEAKVTPPLASVAEPKLARMNSVLLPSDIKGKVIETGGILLDTWIVDRSIRAGKLQHLR